MTHLAETTIDALCHVNIVARSATASVGARLGLDRDGLRRAHGLAQLARDAALLARRVSSQGVLAAEARAQRALLKRVVDGDLDRQATCRTRSATPLLTSASAPWA